MAEILQELQDKFLLFRYTKLPNELINIKLNNNIKENYNNINNEDLIRVLIMGEKKSGKKFLLNQIAKKFNKSEEFYNNYFKFNDIILKIFDKKNDNLNIEIFNSSIIIYITFNYSYQIQEKLIQIKKSKYYNNNTKIIIIHNIYIQFVFKFFEKYFEKIFNSNKNYFKKFDDVDFLYNKFFDNEGFFHLILGDFYSNDDELLHQNNLSIDILYDIIKDNIYYKKYENDLNLIKKQCKFYPHYFYGIENNNFIIKVINHDQKNNIKIKANFDNNSIIEFKIICENEKNFPFKFSKLIKEKINKNKYEINFSVFYKDFPLIDFNPKQLFKNGMSIFIFPIFNNHCHSEQTPGLENDIKE